MRRVLCMVTALLMLCMFLFSASADSYTKADIQRALLGEWVSPEGNYGVVFTKSAGALLDVYTNGSFPDSYGTYTIDMDNNTISLTAPTQKNMEQIVKLPFIYTNGELVLGKGNLAGKDGYMTKTIDKSANKKPVISLESVRIERYYSSTDLYIHFKNNTEKTIDRIDFQLAAFDAYGRLVKFENQYLATNNYWTGKLKPNITTLNYYWRFSSYQLSGVDKFAVRITTYHTTDGKTYKLSGNGYTWQFCKGTR